MRSLLFVLVAVLLVAPQSAEARRGGSKTQEMHFVAETQIPDKDGKPFSLCHLTTKRHMFGIGLWRSSDGYVLSDKKCESDTYYTISDAQFAEAKKSGQIADSVPDEPALTMNMLISGFSGWAILVPLFLFGVYKRIGARKSG